MTDFGALFYVYLATMVWRLTNPKTVKEKVMIDLGRISEETNGLPEGPLETEDIERQG